MTARVAANDLFVRPSTATLKSGEHGVDIPAGHVGPVLLSGTGRTVWWTGRVAIGLRYQPQRCLEPSSASAQWIQSLMLARPRAAAAA